MTYHVMLTDYAVQQLTQIVTNISRLLVAPGAARKWSAKLEKEISSLSVFPLRYPMLEMEPWHSEGIRRMLVDKFVVYYWIDEETRTIWVIAVILGKQDQQMALREVPPIE